MLIAGPTGVGKSQAQALGHCAARQGHDVLFLTRTKLLNTLHAARAVGDYERRLQQLGARAADHRRRLRAQTHHRAA
ncbi:protein of unknown function (plasmid) [Caballeronia sp. S22]